MSDNANQFFSLDDPNNQPVVTIDFEQFEEVSRVFFDESQEIIQAIDVLIMNLEASPADAELLNHLFRRVHTLKGSAGSVPGGQLLASLAHEFETLLSKIKKEKKAAAKECIDLFLSSTRLLKILTQNLREQGEILPEVLSEVIELINHYGQVDVGTFAGEEKKSLPAKAKRAVSIQTDDDGDGVWMTQTQLNELMKVSGEMLLLKNHFQTMMQTGDYETRQSSFNQSLAKVSDHFQSQLAKVMKVQASDCFQSLPTVVRQISADLNKEVVFQTEGLSLWIDKGMGRDIHEAMMHLIRNSIDHGFEDPFERTTKGKASAGQMKFKIHEKNDRILVEFSDDGKGLDRNKILSKAIEKNLVVREGAEKISDQEIFAFIFHPGFSTREKITTISGRGVGMDVVSSIAQKYHGQIHIDSAPDLGTCFRLELLAPQHLVMESVIICRWQNTQMGIPVEQIMQMQSAQELQVTEIEGLRYCQWSGLTVPLLTYAEFVSGKIGWTENKSDSLKGLTALFVRSQDHVVALLTEKIENQVDLVVKPFGKLIGSLPGFRGTAVLADDQVTYVVDPERLIQLLGTSVPKQEAA